MEAGLLYRDMDTWTNQIRTDERFMKIPSIALLMFEEEEAFFRSHLLPVDCFVVNPMDLKETEAIIKDLKDFVGKISVLDGHQKI